MPQLLPRCWRRLAPQERQLSDDKAARLVADVIRQKWVDLNHSYRETLRECGPEFVALQHAVNINQHVVLERRRASSSG
jgi:hypothetical protein